MFITSLCDRNKVLCILNNQLLSALLEEDLSIIDIPNLYHTIIKANQKKNSSPVFGNGASMSKSFGLIKSALLHTVQTVFLCMLYYFSLQLLFWAKKILQLTCSRHRNLQNIRIQTLQIFCYDFFAWSKVGPIAPESHNLS